MSILEEALKAVENRQSSYGNPIDNHKRIAGLWNEYLNNIKRDQAEGFSTIQIKPEEVAIMMILVKIARLCETPGHRDSIIDIAGYAEVLGLIVSDKEEVRFLQCNNCGTGMAITESIIHGVGNTIFCSQSCFEVGAKK